MSKGVFRSIMVKSGGFYELQCKDEDLSCVAEGCGVVKESS